MVELLGIAGRLVPTAQERAGEDLPHHVTVLAPRVNLVVAEVRCRIRPAATLPWRLAWNFQWSATAAPGPGCPADGSLP